MSDPEELAPDVCTALEVTINGVRYVPAVTIIPPSLAEVRRELIELFMGKETETRKWPADIGKQIRVIVTDEGSDGGYPELEPTVDDFVERMTAAIASSADQTDGEGSLGIS